VPHNNERLLNDKLSHIGRDPRALFSKHNMAEWPKYLSSKFQCLPDYTTTSTWQRNHKPCLATGTNIIFTVTLLPTSLPRATRVYINNSSKTETWR